jgi:hypothetical protein
MSEMSPRRQVAGRIANLLGAPLERVEHGGARQGRGRASRKRKHFYRVVLPKTKKQPALVVEIHYPTYIVVNGERFTSIDSAMNQIMNDSARISLAVGSTNRD